jgi:hypothetical protein
MTKKKLDWYANHGATIAGISVAIASAWMTIDFSTFDIKKEWPKLVLSAIIAAGGYKSTLNFKSNEFN